MERRRSSHVAGGFWFVKRLWHFTQVSNIDSRDLVLKKLVELKNMTSNYELLCEG